MNNLQKNFPMLKYGEIAKVTSVDRFLRSGSK